MVFKKTLAQRLFTISSRITSGTSRFRANSRVSAAWNHNAPPQNNLAPDPGDSTDGIFRRHIHRSSAAKTPEMLGKFLPTGDKLFEKIREMGIGQDRLKLDGLRKPKFNDDDDENLVNLKDAVKILKLSQVEVVKEKLRSIEKECIGYDEFLNICCEGCFSAEQGLEFAKMLDQSGTVIILGKLVFLRPEKILKAVEGLISLGSSQHNPNDPRIKQLQEMDKHRADIDARADHLVRRELWLGLGALFVQTVAFMRLTFWELTWDVMEPICFYATSMYFMGGYAFFLRTSKEPSFEGFYQSRFDAKRKKLMEMEKFDVERYNELKRACDRSDVMMIERDASFDSTPNIGR